MASMMVVNFLKSMRQEDDKLEASLDYISLRLGL